MLRNGFLDRPLIAARGAFLSLLVAFCAIPSGAALGQSLIDVFGVWTARAEGQGKARICYMGAMPDKEEGAYKRRGPTYVFVTHRPASKERNVVEVRAGYSYKKESSVTVTIGGNKFSLFTDGDTAWSSNAKADAKLVRAMRRGKTMVVVGFSSRGTKTTDTYSLAGVSAAHNAINKACAVD